MLALFELRDVRLEVLTHLFDPCQPTLALECSLLAIVASCYLRFVCALDPLDRPLWVEQDIVRYPHVLVKRRPFAPPEEVCQGVGRSRVQRPEVDHERIGRVCHGIVCCPVGEIVGEFYSNR